MFNNFLKFDINKINLIDYLILFLIIFLTLYFGFGSYALENMNEGLYGEIAREMLVTGNYIIPHLNFVPYLEKPPMLYWLIAASYHVFGINAFAARLVPVTAGALTCLAFLFFGKALNQARAGWMAAIILATSAGFILISRVIIFDMSLTFFFSSSLLCFFLWYEKESRYYLWFCYGFMALAFLTKGLLSVALIPIIAFVFMLVNKTAAKKFFKAIDPIGILIAAIIIVPWLIAASLKQPGFAWDFFINEQVMRFLDKRFPHDYHTGPFYYYVLPLIVILLPWSILLPTLFKKSKETAAETNFKILKKFLWIWFLIPLLFFSISQAKGQYYIIIAIPPMAMLLALKIKESFANPQSRLLINSFNILIISAIILLGTICFIFYMPGVYNRLPENFQQPTVYAFPLLILLITTIIYGSIGFFLNRSDKKRPVVQFILIAGLIIPWILFLVADKQRLQPQRSEILLGEYILSHHPERPVYLYQDYEDFSSILFYVKKRAIVIDSQSSDLYYGSTTPEGKGWFITAKEFMPQAQQQSVYVVSFNNNLNTFKQAVAPLQFCQVAQSGDIVVLTNDRSECRN